jgi:2-polyprenyl-3-methyl-5-hydroxy-6-metoxy-1,4-benzoquinol methylase
MADLLCLATHAPLGQYDFAADLPPATLPEATWRMQIAEPARETELRARLGSFGRIADDVSNKVRSQYEDHPYPRWVRPRFWLTGASIARMVAQLDLRLTAPGPEKLTEPEILVAGCGTGQQSIEIARRFAGAQVTAIDLSRASLAYAARKTADLGIANIEYLHGDILDLDALGRQFDIVISTGVLHHMADPEAGWRALCRCLRSHGLMKIALYSELARRDIVRLRHEIAENGASTGPEAMRAFRARLLRDPELRDSAFAHSSDFYSLSAFRDLLFHVQEHRFTIPMIGAALDRLGLAFCGFELSGQRSLAAFRARHPDPDARFDLGLWHAFETEHPMTFAGMYQFWCQKL